MATVREELAHLLKGLPEEQVAKVLEITRILYAPYDPQKDTLAGSLDEFASEFPDDYAEKLESYLYH